MLSFVDKIRGLLGKSAAKYDPTPLYEAIVAQARMPDLYREAYQIPNTLDGRFDSLSLHLHLVIRRFGEIEDFQPQVQLLLNRFFTDMDHSVREIGVGDMSVGKHVNKMGKAYFGRVLSYEECMHDPALLAAKLKLNIYGDKTETHDLSLRLAAYVLSQATHLDVQSPQDIIDANVTFLAP